MSLFNKSIHNKKTKDKNKRTFILIVLSLVLIMFVNNTVMSVKDYYDKMLHTNLHGKTIYVDVIDPNLFNESEFLLEQRNNEKVISVFENYQDIELEKYNDLAKELDVVVSGFDYEVYKDYLEDKNIMELNEDEIIIPKYNQTGNDITEQKKDAIIDMSKHIGETVEIKVLNIDGSKKNSEPYKFKIVGVYDNLKSRGTKFSLINSEINIKFKDEYTKDFAPKEDEDEILQVGLEKMYYIYIKDYKDLGELTNKLLQKYEGAIIYSGFEFDQKIYFFWDSVMLVGNFIAFFMFVNTVVLLYYNAENRIKKRRKEFGILKAIGYNNKALNKGIIFENLKMISLSVFASLVIYFIYQTIVNYVIDNHMILLYKDMHLKVDIKVMLLIVLMAFIFSTIGIFVGTKKLSKLDPIEALKDYE